jgi:hypothetical protein
MFGFKRPQISVIVLVYRMQREAPRTLYSLSTAYQQEVRRRDYEVIVVENPSDQMLSARQVRCHGRQFRYLIHPGDPTSPAAAMNFAAGRTCGRTLMLMIDGARILSPGLLHRTLAAQRLYEQPVVASLAWHLGPDIQPRSIHNGYGQEVEDQLLKQADWRNDGYRLFEVSSLAGSCRGSWFGPMLESNCITVSREHYRALGGFCESFRTPGGGFVNLDFFERAVAEPSHPLVLLLGEGTFHQVHGGVATNRGDDEPIARFQEEYRRLRGGPFRPPPIQPVLLGHMPDKAKPFMWTAIRGAGQQYRRQFPSIVRASCTAAEKPEPPVAAGPDSAAPPRTISVLGMHRSGTSCLAGTLMECGVCFGDVSRENPHNKKGNNENRRIMELHDQLLADNCGSWRSPPAYVLWNDERRQTRDEIIDSYVAAQRPCWGFKDPRTLLALDGWLERLPDLHLVGIFRHPDAVAQSLSKRSLIPREEGLELWYQYNRRLLALCQYRPVKLIRFAADPEALRCQLKELIEHLGLSLPSAGFGFFEPALQHCSPRTDRDLPPHVASLLQDLYRVASTDYPNWKRQADRGVAA